MRRLKFQRNDSIPLTLQMVSSYDVNNLRCLPVVTANLTLAPSLEEVLMLMLLHMQTQMQMLLLMLMLMLLLLMRLMLQGLSAVAIHIAAAATGTGMPQHGAAPQG